MVGESGERDREDDEEDRRDSFAGVIEVVARVLAGLCDCFEDADDVHERRVLLESDEVVEERRDDSADRLRQHDVTHRLRVAQPEGARRHPLARVHRLDPRAEYLGDVRRVDEGERDDRVREQRSRRQSDVVERRKALHHEENKDQRRATEDVGVEDRDTSQRESRTPRQSAHDREQEREHENQRFSDEHDLQVDLEAGPDLRYCAEEVERAEERVQELAHSDFLRGISASRRAYFRTGIVVGS